MKIRLALLLCFVSLLFVNASVYSASSEEIPKARARNYSKLAHSATYILY